MRRNGCYRIKDAVAIASRPSAENIITMTAIGVNRERRSEERIVEDGRDIARTGEMTVNYAAAEAFLKVLMNLKDNNKIKAREIPTRYRVLQRSRCLGAFVLEQTHTPVVQCLSGQ